MKFKHASVVALRVVVVVATMVNISPRLALAQESVLNHSPTVEEVTDEQIELGIRHGVNFLMKNFVGGEVQYKGQSRAGVNALCVYALLQAGRSIYDERLNVRGEFMEKALQRMKELPPKEQYMTYSRSLRVAALSVYNRKEDQETLRADVRALVRASANGAYTYGSKSKLGESDNSNSQYGLLGVWSGAEVGMEINEKYWRDVTGHWQACQNPDTGQWGYSGNPGDEPTYSMTCAGLASLFVCHDYLTAPKAGNAVGRPPFSPALARGLEWLEQDDNCLRTGKFGEGGQGAGYNRYGLERVGLASGFKYFGTHDWYREIARDVLDEQISDDGSWNNELVETSFAILFLARGRHPILMNKLRFDGFWANRPRDVANLARFASRELERQLNWQVVNLAVEWWDWLDSPILYISSHQPPPLTDQQIEKLRRFVEGGGLIFTQSDMGDESFNQYVAKLVTEIAPGHELKTLPASHPVYSLVYKIASPVPTLQAVSNGSRLLMVHSPSDISQYWQARSEQTRLPVFQVGVNLFVYATGKANLRNRLDSPYIQPPRQPARQTINVARLRYAGNWDPEPAAWERMGRWLQRDSGCAIDVVTVDIANLTPATAPIAHLTGTAKFELTSAARDALRRYVERGGTVLIDACGGAPAFYESAHAELAKIFPKQKLSRIDPTHPLIAGAGSPMANLTKVELRKFTLEKFGTGGGGGLDILTYGKGMVLLTPFDITSGLLGIEMWEIHGYAPSYARGLVKNLTLWTLRGQPRAVR